MISNSLRVAMADNYYIIYFKDGHNKACETRGVFFIVASDKSHVIYYSFISNVLIRYLHFYLINSKLFMDKGKLLHLLCSLNDIYY